MKAAVVVDGWQGAGSLATDPACLRIADALASGLDRRNITPAFVSPSPPGGLGFYWHGGRAGALDTSLEIELEGNGVDLYFDVSDGDNELEAGFVESAEEALERIAFWLVGAEVGSYPHGYRLAEDQPSQRH